MLDMDVFCYDDPLTFYGLILDLDYMLLVVNVIFPLSCGCQFYMQNKPQYNAKT